MFTRLPIRSTPFGARSSGFTSWANGKKERKKRHRSLTKARTPIVTKLSSRSHYKTMCTNVYPPSNEIHISGGPVLWILRLDAPRREDKQVKELDQTTNIDSLKMGLGPSLGLLFPTFSSHSFCCSQRLPQNQRRLEIGLRALSWLREASDQSYS